MKQDWFIHEEYFNLGHLLYCIVRHICSLLRAISQFIWQHCIRKISLFTPKSLFSKIWLSVNQQFSVRRTEVLIWKVLCSVNRTNIFIFRIRCLVNRTEFLIWTLAYVCQLLFIDLAHNWLTNIRKIVRWKKHQEYAGLEKITRVSSLHSQTQQPGLHSFLARKDSCQWHWAWLLIWWQRSLYYFEGQLEFWTPKSIISL